jgi:hypothetical protein
MQRDWSPYGVHVWDHLKAVRKFGVEVSRRILYKRLPKMHTGGQASGIGYSETRLGRTLGVDDVSTYCPS